MATASLLDKQFIAQDTFFQNMVKASLYQYIIVTIPSETANNHAIRVSYGAQAMNNPNTFVPNFAWAAAQNQTLADAVITTGNAGAHFTTSTTPSAVTTAIQAGITDTLVNNAVAAAFNPMANA